jgi:hypothetical protein
MVVRPRESNVCARCLFANTGTSAHRPPRRRGWRVAGGSLGFDVDAHDAAAPSCNVHQVARRRQSLYVGLCIARIDARIVDGLSTIVFRVLHGM